MKSRMNKADQAYLAERGFFISLTGRLASRLVQGDGMHATKQTVHVRRSGWAWVAQDVYTYEVLGRVERLDSPLAAYAHAEVQQWAS